MDLNGLDVGLMLVLGIVSTFITPLFTSPKMNSHWKNVISVVVAFVISAGYVAITAGWDWANLGTTLAAVYAVNQVVYQQLFKNTAKTIEEVTSGGATEDDYIDVEDEPELEYAGDEKEDSAV